jgi:hypothetical protein
MKTKSLNYFIYTFALIGLVSVLSSFNSNPTQSQIGKYQVSTTNIGDNSSKYIYTTIIDTETGDIKMRTRTRSIEGFVNSTQTVCNLCRY